MEVKAPRFKDLDMLKKMETTEPTGKKLETSLKSIQDLPAKLSQNKANSLLTNKLKKRAKVGQQ